MMDDLQRDANKVRVFNRQGKSDQIDETMLANSNVYRKYLKAKEKLKKLIARQTPTTVAVDINASVASNLTEIR